jgi:curved DNA-binding protein
MEFKDYYQTLGVPRDATADQIKQAYRRLARKYHPDVSKEKDAAQRMSEINEANAVLSDPVRRAAYDELGQYSHAGGDFRPPPDWDAGFEFSGADTGNSAWHTEAFSDFFDALFGQHGGRARRPGPGSSYGSDAAYSSAPSSGGAHPGRGEDHHATVVLDLADAWHGAERQLSLRAPHVDATGRTTVDTRTLNVMIPTGIRAGQQIRLAGQGGRGVRGAPDGDLFLEVRFNPHERFTVDGRDLKAVLQVAPWEAALGAVVPVNMPDGSLLKVRIPAGTQSGNTLTVTGKGLPSQPPGNLDLSVQVVLPPADTPQARDLYKTMAQELAFDPRSAQTANKAGQGR